MFPSVLHHNLAAAIVLGLEQIFVQNRYADMVVAQLLQSNPKWGSRDRHVVAFNLYEIVRHWRLLCQTAGFNTPEQPRTKQLWQLLGVWLLVNNQPLPNFAELPEIDPKPLTERYHSFTDNVPVRESISDWLHELGSKQLGQRWEAELTALNHPANLILRVNRLKTDLQHLIAFFEQAQLPASTLPGLPDALMLSTHKQVIKTDAYKKGWFEVQDAASQMVAPFLDAQKNMVVLDACAGAGGKTLHLAALLQNQGTLLAYDTDTGKLEELQKRATRNGAKVQVIYPDKRHNRINEWKGKVQRLLLDAPCTGLGTLKRKPDIKWKLNQKKLELLLHTQQHILQQFTPFLQTGGVAVYATCSILPQENEQQIAHFIKQTQGQFTLLEEKHIWPSETGFDGFYMAKLQKL